MLIINESLPTEQTGPALHYIIIVDKLINPRNKCCMQTLLIDHKEEKSQQVLEYQ